MVHLHAVDNGDEGQVDVSAKVDAIFFMVERDGASWSPAAKIWGVYPEEGQAEASAKVMKQRYPQRHFGVAVLRSEVRHVAKPVEIVRVVPPPGTEERPHT